MGGSVFPVEPRWALVWEDIEENLETARRVRQDPESWVPVSFEAEYQELDEGFLDMMTAEVLRTTFDGC